MIRKRHLLLALPALAAGWVLAQTTVKPPEKPAEEKPVPEVKPFNPSEQIPVDVAVDFPADI